MVTHDGAAAGERVLVVEDDPATSLFLRRALTRAGFAVTAAGDAHEALALAREGRWDAAIVDIGLPGASGFDVVHELRAAHPHLPVALMTADARMDVAVRALRSEVDDFLPKPIAPDALVTQVRRLVRRRGARRSAERVLGIGAHPDDVEIGVGGLLLGHRQAGDEVAVLTLTQGARGGDRSARAEEAERAAELLGARLFLRGLDDMHISESDPTVGIIEEVVAEVAPTVVYVHSWNDLHQDHRNTHRAALVATRRVPSVYCYESPSATVEFRPARFVAIDGSIDRKLAVIEAYASQVAIRTYLDPELVRSTSRYWGRYGDSRYCEPLEVVRERSNERAPVVVGGARAEA
jgi:LmbE family N-acetylglucosaminyl deacetylase/ActR/RegA family two-component response regulator